jgi:hypothetical protein
MVSNLSNNDSLINFKIVNITVVGISTQLRKNSEMFRWVASNFYTLFKSHLLGAKTANISKPKIQQPKIHLFTTKAGGKNPNDDFEELHNYEEDLEDYEEGIVQHPSSSFDDVIEETLIDYELTIVAWFREANWFRGEGNRSTDSTK